MSFRLAASVVRDRAEAARRRADGCGISDIRMGAFKRRLHESDVQALDAWLARRIAQELDLAADELAARASEDVTVLERKPGSR